MRGTASVKNRRHANVASILDSARELRAWCRRKLELECSDNAIMFLGGPVGVGRPVRYALRADQPVARRHGDHAAPQRRAVEADDFSR